MIKNDPRLSAAKEIDTVILVAGLSTRMRAFKPLLPFGQSTMIETVVETALEISQQVIVVVGFRAKDIVNLKRWNERVEFVENKHYEKGMFSSVKVGAAQVKTACFFIALGDQPQIPATVFDNLLKAEPADVIQPSFDGKNGHPILLNEKVRAAILAADENDPNVSLRAILEPFQKRVVGVNEPGILIDFDTPDDFSRG
jgi:molybdenum cofactor cytidylyltransferase